MNAGRAGRYQRLSRTFYSRPADVVAPDLLGCQLVRRWRNLLFVGRIVETEAYVGVDDLACHASKGRTPRNDVMFGPPGRAYVYFIYGMYDMLNVVCQRAGCPEAVLIRAVEPLAGVDIMRRRRAVRRDIDVANGPGKLCRAFAIHRRHNGIDLRGDQIWVAPGGLAAGESVATSRRIGVDYAGADALRPLRFYVLGHPHVSRPRRAVGNRARQGNRSPTER